MASDEPASAPLTPGSQSIAIDDHYRLLLQKDATEREIRSMDLRRAGLCAQRDQLQAQLDRIAHEAVGKASMQPRPGDAK